MPQHMKAIAMPRTWSMPRKETTWVSVPKGAHKQEFALSVNAVFKDLLKIAKTTKEVRYIIFNKFVYINGKKITSEKAQFGLFDVLTLPETKQSFTLVFTPQGKLAVKELKEAESKIKISKIIGKAYLPKKKVQLNLFEGINIIVDKDTYKVGDSVIISLPDYKVKQHIALEKGVMLYLLSGQHTSEIATVVDIADEKIMCKTKEAEFAVHKRQIFIIGKDKPVLTL